MQEPDPEPSGGAVGIEREPVAPGGAGPLRKKERGRRRSSRPTEAERDGGPSRRQRARHERSTRRLASSIRVPWAVGLASLLVLAAAGGLLLGRSDQGRLKVPRPMLDDQQIITQAVAQSIRKSANEGVYDLVEAAGVLAAEVNPNHALMLAVLQALTAAHDRYTSAYVLAGTDQVLASVGDQPLPQLLQRQPPFDGPGMQDARLVLKRAEAILQFAPVPTTGGGAPLTVVAVYDPAFLRFSLQPALPGDAWLLNGRGQVLAGLDQSDPFSNLPSRALQEAARKVTRGQTGVMTTGQSLDTQELIGYAPVTGLGPAGQLGWSMVTARRVSNFSLPQADVRRQGILAGILLALLAVLAFLWLYAVIVAPVVRLQRDAERVAYGDLAKSVEVVRYDEIGLAARALERIRVLLIRRRVHGQDKEPPPT